MSSGYHAARARQQEMGRRDDSSPSGSPHSVMSPMLPAEKPSPPLPPPARGGPRAKQPATAVMNNSSSLPSLKKSYADGSDVLKRELIHLRRRHKEMEAELRRARAASKGRELDRVYGTDRAAEGGPEAAREGIDDELKRVRDQCRRRVAELEHQHGQAMAAAAQETAALRAALAKATTHTGLQLSAHGQQILEERERVERMARLRSRASRRLMHRSLSRAWDVWHATCAQSQRAFAHATSTHTHHAHMHTHTCTHTCSNTCTHA